MLSRKGNRTVAIILIFVIAPLMAMAGIWGYAGGPQVQRTEYSTKW